MEIYLNVVPVITGQMKHQTEISPDSLPIKKELLAIQSELPENQELDVLIGNDYFLDFMLEQKIEVRSGLYLLESKLGWILSGRVDHGDFLTETENTCVLSMMGCIHSCSSENIIEPEIIDDENMNVKNEKPVVTSRKLKYEMGFHAVTQLMKVQFIILIALIFIRKLCVVCVFVLMFMLNSNCRIFCHIICNRVYISFQSSPENIVVL